MSDVEPDIDLTPFMQEVRYVAVKLELVHEQQTISFSFPNKIIIDDIKILRKEKIAGSDFLKLTKEDFRSISFALGLTTRLTEFIEGLSQKLRNYSSLKTLDDLKEMLCRNKVN